jgi:hypothetical protein
LRNLAVFGDRVSRTGLTPRRSSVETRRAFASSTRIAPRGLGALALVVGDHAVRDADGGAQLVLGEALGLPQGGEPGLPAGPSPSAPRARHVAVGPSKVRLKASTLDVRPRIPTAQRLKAGAVTT